MRAITTGKTTSRPLRIQVDARLLRGGGIGRYIREVTGRWLSRPDVGALRYFGRPGELEPFLAEWDARGIAEVVVWADRPYSPMGQMRWPLLAHRLSWPADVTFLPHYDVPLLRPPTPSVVTIHDLIHFERPYGFPAWKRALGMTLMRRAMEGATAIVTVSDASRRAIAELSPSLARKVHVVRNGVGEEFRPLTSTEAAAASREWGHLQPFVLCVGPNKPHKNLAQAMDVLARLPAEEEWRLVLVGPSRGDVDRLVARSGIPEVGSRVVVTGPVTDGDLRSLYGLAAAVLVPSRQEGFGLPVLEASACGARVIVRDLPWARELPRPGVTLMSSWSPRAWAKEVQTPLPDGRAIARDRWTWDVAAERTFDLLTCAAEVGERKRVF